MIFTMTDETYVVNCNLEDQDKEQVMFYVALFSRCYWLIGTALGAVLGNLIPFDLTGIDFCMTALFIIIFMYEMTAQKIDTDMISLMIHPYLGNFHLR